MLFNETSAKDNINVDHVFMKLLDKIVAKVSLIFVLIVNTVFDLIFLITQVLFNVVSHCICSYNKPTQDSICGL